MKDIEESNRTIAFIIIAQFYFSSVLYTLLYDGDSYTCCACLPQNNKKNLKKSVHRNNNNNNNNRRRKRTLHISIRKASTKQPSYII